MRVLWPLTCPDPFFFCCVLESEKDHTRHKVGCKGESFLASLGNGSSGYTLAAPAPGGQGQGFVFF